MLLPVTKWLNFFKGVKVVLWDINEKNMNKVVDEIKDVNGEAFSYVCDVTNKDEVYETASKVRLDVGDVDILVNNAGVVTGKNFLSCSDKEIEKTMNVNLMAHYWVSENCWSFLTCTGSD
jgi:all-trans-retinol dehydrogenase (NAD+)